MIDTSAVDGFLASALRTLRSGGDVAWPHDDMPVWQSVWSRIDYHGIPLLLHSAKDRLGGWPIELLDRIDEEARLIVLWETTHFYAVKRVISALDIAEIASIVMKGTALAYAFHTEPAARRRGDTDLLIHPADKERARAIFRENGWYRRDDPHGLYSQEGWLHDAAGFFVHSIDLHWEPTDRPVLHDVLPIDRFFAQKEPVQALGRGAFRPDLATMVIHATTNQKWHAQHGYEAEEGRVTGPRRLMWSVDFDLMINSMTDADWKALIDHCSRVGIGPLVAEALLGAHKDLCTSLPDDAIAQLQSAPLDGGIQTYFSNSDSLSQFWLDVKKTRGIGKKTQLILGRAFAPRGHLIEKYPSAKNWPTLALQGRLLIETAARLVRRGGAS